MVIKTVLLRSTPQPDCPTTMSGGSTEPRIKANSQGWPQAETDTEGIRQRRGFGFRGPQRLFVPLDICCRPFRNLSARETEILTYNVHGDESNSNTNNEHLQRTWFTPDSALSNAPVRIIQYGCCKMLQGCSLLICRFLQIVC